MSRETVGGLLRQADPETYFASLLAPETARPALAALYLFAHEIAHVRDHAREPAMGEIRLQWWAEALAGARDEEARGHPLAAALLAAATRHNLPRSALATMVEAHRSDLYDDAPPTTSDAEGHAGETAGAMLRLAALIVAPDAQGPLADLAGHGGCALAFAATLRRLALSRRRGQCPLPLDLIGAHALDREGFLRGGESSAKAVAGFADLGRDHWREFLRTAAAMPPEVRPAFALVAPAARILARAARNPARVVVEGVAAAPLRDRWAMLRAAAGRWPSLR